MPLERTNQSWHNPLLERVHRHATLATLFRKSGIQPAGESKPRQAGAGLILGQIGAPALLPVATAVAGGEHTAMAASVLTSNHELAITQGVIPTALPIAKTVEPAAPIAIQRAQPGGATATIAAPDIAKAEVPISAADMPPEIASATASPLTDNERLWQRLRAIKQSHEVQQTEAEGASAQVASDSRQEVSPMPIEPKTVITTQLEPLTAEPTTAQSANKHSALLAHSPAIHPISPSMREQISEVVAPDNPVVQSSPVVPQASTATLNRKAVDTADEVPPAEIEGSPPQSHEQHDTIAAADQLPESLMQRQPRSQSSAATKGIVPVTPVEETPTRSVQASTVDVTSTMSGDSSLPIPLPLQSVWPVEQINNHEPVSEPGIVDQVHGHVQRAAIDPYLQADIQQKLQTIRPGQPTEAAVDVIPPRRPRPAAKKSPVMTSKEMDQGETHGATMQRSAASTSAPSTQSNKQSTTGQINTEIGPLPTDLWQLIGQTPIPTPSLDEQAPKVEARPSTTAATAQPGEEQAVTGPDSKPAPPVSHPAVANTAMAAYAAPVSSDNDPSRTTIQRQTIGSAVSHSADESSSSTIVATSAKAGISKVTDRSAELLLSPSSEQLQRVADVPELAGMDANPRPVSSTAKQDEIATSAVQTPQLNESPLSEGATALEAQPTTVESGKKTLASVDTDELARQVYLQLKQQLIIERERLRY